MNPTFVAVLNSAVVSYFGLDPKVVGSNPGEGNNFFFFLISSFLMLFNSFLIKNLHFWRENSNYFYMFLQMIWEFDIHYLSMSHDVDEVLSNHAHIVFVRLQLFLAWNFKYFTKMFIESWVSYITSALDLAHSFRKGY